MKETYCEQVNMDCGQLVIQKKELEELEKENHKLRISNLRLKKKLELWQSGKIIRKEE